MKAPVFRDTENARVELIQIAAVAVAMVEDLDYGEANFTARPDGPLVMQGPGVAHEVMDERIRQDAKWGPQSHRPHDWLMILMEEVGEFAEEIQGPDPKGLRQITVNNGRGARRYLKEVFGQ